MTGGLKCPHCYGTGRAGGKFTGCFGGDPGLCHECGGSGRIAPIPAESPLPADGALGRRDGLAYQHDKPSCPSPDPIDVGELEMLLNPAPFLDGGVGDAMFKAAHEYASDYIMTTEGDDYEPTEFERDLITDFYNGLISDERFFGPVRILLARARQVDGLVSDRDEARAERDALTRPVDDEDPVSSRASWRMMAEKATARLDEALSALDSLAENVSPSRDYPVTMGVAVGSVEGLDIALEKARAILATLRPSPQTPEKHEPMCECDVCGGKG